MVPLIPGWRLAEGIGQRKKARHDYSAGKRSINDRPQGVEGQLQLKMRRQDGIDVAQEQCVKKPAGGEVLAGHPNCPLGAPERVQLQFRMNCQGTIDVTQMWLKKSPLAAVRPCG
jgi:hypothetical protein